MISARIDNDRRVNSSRVMVPQFCIQISLPGQWADGKAMRNVLTVGRLRPICLFGRLGQCQVQPVGLSSREEQCRTVRTGGECSLGVTDSSSDNAAIDWGVCVCTMRATLQIANRPTETCQWASESGNADNLHNLYCKQDSMMQHVLLHDWATLLIDQDLSSD